MLGVEVSEIGATLIALSVPGVKPLVDKYILRKDAGTQSGGSKYQMKGSSHRSKGTALSTLRLRAQHSMLASTENTTRYDTEVVGGSQHDNNSQDGIYVSVDFEVKEGHLESGRGGGRPPRGLKA